MTAPHTFEASYAVTRSGDARVSLGGELDHATAPQVRDAVAACMAQRPRSLCLDLSGVSFCDCSGLNVLLEARVAAILARAELVVEGIGAQLERLLSLTGAGDILAKGHLRTNSLLARSE